MKIFPAVDVIKGKTVRLEQGDFDRKLSYDMAPVDAARKWEDMGAEVIHVVDLEGAKAGGPRNLDIATEIARTVNVPVQLGGGFRRQIDIKKALNAGVWRVVVGSKALEEFAFARDVIETFKDRVIISVDAKSYDLKSRGWEEKVEGEFFYVLDKFVSFGAKEIIYTDILVDGTLSGPSIDRIEEILDKVDVKIIAAGGIKDVEHIRQMKRLEPKGLTGVIIGRALYEGTIDLKEAIDAGKADSAVS